jgi:hypothetical protein
MEGAYRYVIHAYEDARQKRPMKHEHGGTTVLTDGAEALGRAEVAMRSLVVSSRVRKSRTCATTAWAVAVGVL